MAGVEWGLGGREGAGNFGGAKDRLREFSGRMVESGSYQQQRHTFHVLPGGQLHHVSPKHGAAA